MGQKMKSTIIIILLTALLVGSTYVPEIQAEQTSRGDISFNIEKEYNQSMVPGVSFKEAVRLEIEYKPKIKFTYEKMLPDDAKDLEVSLKDEKATIKLIIPDIVVSIDGLGERELHTPVDNIPVELNILGEKTITFDLITEVFGGWGGDYIIP